jgi:hypothetical protein
VRLEGLDKLKEKHPMTSLGIELTTFRLEAWCLNQTRETKERIGCSHLFIIICRSCWSVKCGKKKAPWSESASELHRPSDRRLSAKLLPTFADKGCHVVSVTDLYDRILGFLDRSRYFSIK